MADGRATGTDDCVWGYAACYLATVVSDEATRLDLTGAQAAGHEGSHLCGCMRFDELPVEHPGLSFDKEVLGSGLLEATTPSHSILLMAWGWDVRTQADDRKAGLNGSREWISRAPSTRCWRV